LARQIYYAARPTILDVTEKDTLDANYFIYTLLPLFMKEHAQLTGRWRVHFKPRGNLTEPHTGLKVPLGTAEVDEYRRGWTNGIFGGTGYTIKPWLPNTRGPHNRFGGVLAIEKEGFADLLIEVGIGRKYDLAIIGNEGQSVEAELALAEALNLPLFIIRDRSARSQMAHCSPRVAEARGRDGQAVRAAGGRVDGKLPARPRCCHRRPVPCCR
jgi:hypothetical protein